MCDHENRERAMVTIRRDGEGVPTVWCDPCIVPLVTALNDGGLATMASCCGHGKYPGWVMLRDGRSLVLMSHDEMRALARDGSGT